MNFLDFHKRIPSLLPDVIDAFVEVYGEKHRDTITERLNTTLFVNAYPLYKISNYIRGMKTSKRNQLGVEFIQYVCENVCDVGIENIDFNKQYKQGYTEPLDQNISNLLLNYIGYLDIFDDDKDALSERIGILSWLPDENDKDEEPSNTEQIKINRTRFINFIRENCESITVEGLDEFYKTEEYSEIKKKIDLCIKKILDLKTEYYSFLEHEIAPIEHNMKNKIEHLAQFEQNEKNEIFLKIFSNLPSALQSFFNTRYSSINEKSNALFYLGTTPIGLGVQFDIEVFRPEETCTHDSQKYIMYSGRVSALKFFGIDITDIEKRFIADSSTWIDYKRCYEKCLEIEGAKELIIEPDVIKQIIQLREDAHERINRERIDYNSCITRQNSENNKEFYESIKNDLIDYLFNQMDKADGEAIYIKGSATELLNKDFIIGAMIFLGRVSQAHFSYRLL